MGVAGTVPAGSLAVDMDETSVAASEELVALGLAALVYAGALTAFVSWRAMAILATILGVLQLQFIFDLSIIIGSFNLMPFDMLAVVLAVASVPRHLMRGRPDLLTGCWLAFAVWLLIAFLRGASAHGLTTAAVSFRTDLYFVVVSVYLLSFTWTPRDLDGFVKLWFAAAAALSAYALVCWIDPSLTVWSWMLVDRSGRMAFLNWRVLPASSALLIAEAGLLSIALWSRSSGLSVRRFLAVPFLIVVVLLYHRSVWTATAVSLAALFALRPQFLQRLALPVVLAMVAFAVTWAMSLGLGGDFLSEALSSAVAEPFDDRSTWTWRTVGWEVIVPEILGGGPITMLFGNGYGTGVLNPMTGLPMANPHNAYVEILMNAGVVGVVLLVGCYALPLWTVWNARAEEGRHFTIVSAMFLLVTLVIYSVPYSPGGEQGVVIGAAVGLAARCRRERPAPAAGFGAARPAL